MLIDGPRLAELVIEFGVAVATSATYTAKRIYNEFSETKIRSGAKPKLFSVPSRVYLVNIFGQKAVKGVIKTNLRL